MSPRGHIVSAYLPTWIDAEQRREYHFKKPTVYICIHANCQMAYGRAGRIAERIALQGDT